MIEHNERIENAISIAVELLGDSEWTAVEVEDLDAVRVYEATRGGRTLLVDPDGQVLFASSGAPRDQIAADFNAGIRTPADAFANGSEQG